MTGHEPGGQGQKGTESFFRGQCTKRPSQPVQPIKLILLLADESGAQFVTVVQHCIELAPVNSTQAALRHGLDAYPLAKLPFKADDFSGKKKGQDLPTTVLAEALQAQDAGSDEPHVMTAGAARNHCAVGCFVFPMACIAAYRWAAKRQATPLSH